MKRKLAQKVISFVCAVSVMMQIAAPAFAAGTDIPVTPSETTVETQVVEEEPKVDEESIVVEEKQNEEPAAPEEKAEEAAAPEVVAEPEAPAEAGRIEDNDSAVVWKGWNTWTYDQAKGLTTHYGNAVGSTVTVKFNGTGISVFGKKAFNGPIVTAKIDDMAPQDVDFYARGNDSNEQKICEIAGLQPGDHTLVMTITERFTEGSETSSEGKRQAEINYFTVEKASAPVEPEKPTPNTSVEANLVAGEQNGNKHFGGDKPEAFVLTTDSYNDEAFSFTMKLNSEKDASRFRFVTKYVNDSEWGYIAYDGQNNHWFYEFSNGTTGYPNLNGLPAVNTGDVVEISGEYVAEGLKIKVNNTTTNKTGEAIANDAAFLGLKGKTGKVGFGAAKYESQVTDVTVSKLVVGNKAYAEADYNAMTKYNNQEFTWTVKATEPTEPTEPTDPVKGKMWYKLSGGAKNSNGHDYGDATKNAPVVALDKTRPAVVGQTASLSLKPSVNCGVFYTYIDDANWLYVGYDSSSHWYYEYRINGKGAYQPNVVDFPAPVEGKEMTLAVNLSRETLTITVNGVNKSSSQPALLPFSEKVELKDKGHFGVKTTGATTVYFSDVKLGETDCMEDQWSFAAERDGQGLEKVYTQVRPLTGTVKNTENQPIADATVTVGSLQAKTNENGEYTFKALEVGSYDMAVSKMGYESIADKVTIAAEGTNTKNFVLQKKADLDLTKFDTIENDVMKVYIGKTFPVVARYEMKAGEKPFFRGNEQAEKLNTVKINGKVITPKVEVTAENAISRDYKLSIKDADAKLDFDMVVRISIAENTLTWNVVELTKADSCAAIASIEVPQLNLLSVDFNDEGARFDGANASSDTTISGDSFITFNKNFTPSNSGSYLYGFLSNGKLSAGLFSNSEIEGDRRVVRNNGADTMSLTSNAWYYERGDKEGQKRTNLTYPVSELPCAKVAIGADENGDGAIDWNDGALAYRKIMHVAYGSDQIKDIVNYRIIMNFASMAPDPFLASADSVKKVFLATDGLPQALLLKGYGNEGHDSANSEYADIAEREGGVEDFRKLIEIAHQYNTEVGVHINAQEAYPEAKSFCPELIGGLNGTGNGWGWLDQSHVIDKHWDLASEARWKRLVQFYDRINNTKHLNRDWEKGEYVLNSQGEVDVTMDELKKEAESKPNNMDFIYLDVWYQDAWETRQIAKQINSLGWRFSTEFSLKGEYDSTWQHWSTEASYGGKEAKGYNSDIIRFIRNDQRDSQVLNHPAYGGTADNPLLGGYELYGFEGWGNQRDFGDYIRNTFNNNLPTKFLQHYYVTDWENYTGENGDVSPVGNHEKQITLMNDAGHKVVVTRKSKQRQDANIERTITLQRGDRTVKVLDDVTYLLPWTDNQDKTEKLYHFNLDGGTTTWDLPGDWNELGEVIVYKVTDQGRVEPKTVQVNNGQITLTAEAGVPYVVVKTEGKKQLKADFGEGDYVVDPGFNGYAGNGSKLDKAEWSGDIADPSVTVELSETKDQRLQFASPAKDVAVSTKINNLIPGKDYVAEIYVQNDTDFPATLEVNNGKDTVSVWAGYSYAKNYVRCDNKSAYSSMQRMQVSFKAESATATLTLKRAAGKGNTYMDSIRIVEQKVANYQPDGSFKQDFESVVQGLYPFVLGPAQGVNDPRTHLSQLHAPYTQFGWNNRVVDDVIEGEWSLKHHSNNSGIIYQTLPQNFRFEPGKFYTVEFDYQTGANKAYAMVVGERGQYTMPTADEMLPVTGGTGNKGNTQHYVMQVRGAASGNTWIGLYSNGQAGDGAFGQNDFILDNLVIKEDPSAVLVNLSATELFKGETADIIVETNDPKGGVSKWENTDPTVAVVEDGQVKALKAGTTTLTATLSNGKTKTFVITVKGCELTVLPTENASASANTHAGGSEPAPNGFAAAAADGKSETYWHSQWSGFEVSEKHPAVLTVDFGKNLNIDGFRIQQRPSGGENGKVKKFSYRILDENGKELKAGGPVNVPASAQGSGAWFAEMFDTSIKNARKVEISVLSGHGNFAAIAEVQAVCCMKVADEATLQDMTIKVNEKNVMDIKPVGDNTVLKGIVWSTKDTDIIKLDQDGTVTGLKAGKATVTVTNAAGLKATATVTVTTDEVPPVTLDRIEITKNPSKMEYVAGENFDASGMELTVHYSNGVSKVITKGWTITNGEALKEGEQTITISYAEEGSTPVETTLKVTVKVPVDPEKPVTPEKPVEPVKPVEPETPAKPGTNGGNNQPAPAQPGTNGNSSQPAPARPGNGAATGDTTNMGLWIVLLVVCGALAGGAYYLSKKKSNKK